MKHWIKNELIRAAGSLGIELESLSDLRSNEIRSSLSANFCVSSDAPFSYQNLKDFEGVCSQEAWKWATEIINASPVLFFLNPNEEITIWRIRSSKELQQLLAETFGFPFYVTTENLKSLACVDDHNCLLCVGDCKAQLESYRNSQ